MFWSEENVERLKTLYDEGLSFSQIARALGQGCTCNGALGKAHRLGITGNRPSGIKSGPASIPRTGGGVVALNKRVKPLPKVPDAPAPDPVLDAEGRPITLRTVGKKQCRWYVADESGADGQLCANPTKGGPWCDHHAGRLRNATAMQKARQQQNAVPTVKARALKHA